ncbi:MAG TPA: hypothetical protein VHR46_04635 [Gaiella sp.]|nr:hypothetical protein [Gaiella sp.]
MARPRRDGARRRRRQGAVRARAARGRRAGREGPDRLGRRARGRGFTHRAAPVNGEPGIVFYASDGRAVWVAALEIADGVVVAVRSVLNPDKLAHVLSR